MLEENKNDPTAAAQPEALVNESYEQALPGAKISDKRKLMKKWDFFLVAIIVLLSGVWLWNVWGKEPNLITRQREIAALALQTGEIVTARAALDKILDIAPEDLDAITRLGHIYRLHGELGKAEAAFQKVLALAGEDKKWQAVALAMLGIVYDTRGNLEKAEVYYKKIEVDIFGLPNAYWRHGDLLTAEAYYQNSLMIDEVMMCKDGIVNQFGMFDNVYIIREWVKPEGYYMEKLAIEEALGRMEGMANAYANLGIVYRKRGDLEKAEEYYKKALDIDETLGRMEGMALNYYNLGLLAEKRGDMKTARVHWTRSLELYKQLGEQPMIEIVQSWMDELGEAGK